MQLVKKEKEKRKKVINKKNITSFFFNNTIETIDIKPFQVRIYSLRENLSIYFSYWIYTKATT